MEKSRMNIVAPYNSMSYGLISSWLSLSLDQPSLFPIGHFQPDNSVSDRLLPLHNAYTRFDKNAPSLRIFHQFSMAEHVGRPKIGYTVFEKDYLNERDLHHLKSLDLVVSPTRWQVDVLSKHGIKSEIIPFGWIFEPPTPKEPQDQFTFICVGKFELRKGQDFVIKCFNVAFSKKDDVKLILHCHNPFGDNRPWQKMAKESPLGDKIELSDPLTSHDQVLSLMQNCHCGLFLSRAEGWNLPLSEMISLGRPVIATNFSGHTEILRPSFALPVQVKATVGYDGNCFDGNSSWADLDDDALDQVVSHMRNVYKNWNVNTAGMQVGQLNNWDLTASKFEQIAKDYV